MAEYRQLIERLRAKRRQLKLTQFEVSSRMGLTDNLVNRWEKLQRFPKGPLLILWAQTLGLNLEITPDNS